MHQSIYTFDTGNKWELISCCSSLLIMELLHQVSFFHLSLSNTRHTDRYGKSNDWKSGLGPWASLCCRQTGFCCYPWTGECSVVGGGGFCFIFFACKTLLSLYFVSEEMFIFSCSHTSNSGWLEQLLSAPKFLCSALQ